MARFLSGRGPSPATAIAFTALLVALSGTAIALPGRGTVDSGDLRRGAVKTSDLGRNAVTGPKVRNSSLRGADVRNESLSGLDIDESTLGQVPSANAANTANSANTAARANTADTATSVQGVSFARIDYRAQLGTGPQPILSLNGLTLSATCPTEAGFAISATTSVNNAMIHWAVNHNLNPVDNDTPPGQSEDNFSLYDEEEIFNPGVTVLIADDNGTTAAAPDSTQGTLTYARPGGGIVTATFMTEVEEDLLAGTDDCFVIGHAQSSG